MNAVVVLANKTTLSRDLWPEDISVLQSERTLTAESLPSSRIVPLDEDQIASWVCVDMQPELGQALVYVRQDDVASGSSLAGESVELLVRVQGVVQDINLSVGGDWDGTLPNAMRACQNITLAGGGCHDAFDPQVKCLRSLRSVVLRALGKSVVGDGRRDKDTLSLQRRVFTKIRVGVNDSLSSLLKKEEDPKGKFREIERTWRVTERVLVASHTANGEIRRVHPLAVRKGDMVDVAVRIVVAFRGGKHYDVYYEPTTVVRVSDHQRVGVRVFYCLRGRLA
ncbi:hypothetical protein FKP32DRAFT_1575994 [Trametes sanguinea]|nr:hypothetical protein FKP32DRAFT_1575994 [Trametes sanguinea]